MPIADVLKKKNETKPVPVYETEAQIVDTAKGPEGYDYESLIRTNAL